MAVFKSIRAAERGHDNIADMFLSTALSLIFVELIGVAAVFIDGIVSSQFLGTEVYSGIALLRPYSSIVMAIAAFLSVGCSNVCSRMIGAGEKEKANQVFNMVSMIALIVGVLLFAVSVFFPDAIFRMCGVPPAKYPDLEPHMLGYLRGLMYSGPAVMLLQVMGPLFVLDNGKKLFTVSAAALCAADITGDLLNVFVFHGGAFGMGLATTVGYYVQLVILFWHFRKPEHYFRLSPKSLRFHNITEVLRKGIPPLFKKLCGTGRDILVNYVNIIIALSAVAIAARGIQNDIYSFLLCFPAGLGRALVNMTGIYHGANDRRGLNRLYTYSLRVGFIMSVIIAGIVILAAPLITRAYTGDPEVISMSVFAIRWIAVSMVFDTSLMIYQHYMQGIGNVKIVNLMNLAERLTLPVVFAVVLGGLFGSKGVLASIAVSRMFLMACVFVADCIRCKGVPQRIKDVMFLPDEFGGDETDNAYGEIRTMDDAIRESIRAKEFCLEHGTSMKAANRMSLFVEEMAADFMADAERAKGKRACLDYRLFINEDDICLSMMDRINHLNANSFSAFNDEEDMEAYLGIRMVLKMAKEVRFYTAYNSNNLIIYMSRQD